MREVVEALAYAENNNAFDGSLKLLRPCTDTKLDEIGSHRVIEARFFRIGIYTQKAARFVWVTKNVGHLIKGALGHGPHGAPNTGSSPRQVGNRLRNFFAFNSTDGCLPKLFDGYSEVAAFEGSDLVVERTGSVGQRVRIKVSLGCRTLGRREVGLFVMPDYYHLRFGPSA